MCLAGVSLSSHTHSSHTHPDYQTTDSKVTSNGCFKLAVDALQNWLVVLG